MNTPPMGLQRTKFVGNNADLECQLCVYEMSLYIVIKPFGVCWHLAFNTLIY